MHFICDFLHLHRKVLHPLLQLHVIISQQDSGTGDNDINIGFTFVSSMFHPWLLYLVYLDRPNKLVSIRLLDNEHVACETEVHH